MGRIELPYLQVFKDRHGRVRHYYRRRGRRVSLPGAPGSEEWLTAYWAERKRDEGAIVKPGEPERSFNRLAQIYFSSSDFRSLRASTRTNYRCSIEPFLEQYGRLPVAGAKHDHIARILGDMEDRPAAANKLLKRLRQLFRLAMRLEWIERDPTLGVKPYRLGEIETWTDAEIEQYLERWEPGTRQRLAFMLHLHTGQRNSDVTRLVWPSDGLISFSSQKTKTKLCIPVSEALGAELRLHPKIHAVILTTAYGHPFSVAGYGNWMRANIRAAGVEKKTHGLRKAAARQLAEAGCSAHEIMAITGHQTLAEVERYTRAVQQQRLARQALAKRFRNR